MGTAKVSDSSSGNRSARNHNETDVILNVYDLTPYNNYTYWFGFGIYHSGIEVHGKEYGFGAHDFPISGVFEVEPRSCPGFIYRCSISLGRINMLSSEFRSFIEDVASEYHGDTYHLISKNCNHFTDDMALRLMGKSIPGWVNRMARLGMPTLPTVYHILVGTRILCMHTYVSVTLDDIKQGLALPYIKRELRSFSGSLCSCLLPESLQVTKVKELPEYHDIEDGVESASTSTPRDSPEIDDTDQEKHLFSSNDGNSEISFIKEAQGCCKMP